MSHPTLSEILERRADELTPERRPKPIDARARWLAHRLAHGRAAGGPYLSAPDGNAKMMHTARPTWTLQLAPARSSGLVNVCGTEASCARVCVGGTTCGRASFDPQIPDARAMRVAFLLEEPADALALIAAELHSNTFRRDPVGRVIGRRRIGARLNAFSDIRWELIAPDLLDIPYVDAYDYTKHEPDARAEHPRYPLIWSIDERDDAATIAAKAERGPIAVVFDASKGTQYPERWGPYPIADGDADDYRNALQPAGTVVALYLKGREAERARRSGFARDPWSPPAEQAPRPRTRRPFPLPVVAA